MIALTNALFWAEAANDPIAQFARKSLSAFAAPAVPYVLGRRRLVAEAARLLSQLRVHYRDSELSVEGAPPGRRGPRPGDRLRGRARHDRWLSPAPARVDCSPRGSRVARP